MLVHDVLPLDSASGCRAALSWVVVDVVAGVSFWYGLGCGAGDLRFTRAEHIGVEVRNSIAVASRVMATGTLGAFLRAEPVVAFVDASELIAAAVAIVVRTCLGL